MATKTKPKQKTKQAAPAAPKVQARPMFNVPDPLDALHDLVTGRIFDLPQQLADAVTETVDDGDEGSSDEADDAAGSAAPAAAAAPPVVVNIQGLFKRSKRKPAAAGGGAATDDEAAGGAPTGQ